MTAEERHVGFFLPSLKVGGAERAMVGIANGVANHSDPPVNVDLVVGSRSGPFLDEVSPRVRLVDLKCSSTATSVPKLARYLLRARPQALVTTLDHANVVAILTKAITRTKTKVLVRVATTLSAKSKEQIGLKYRLVQVLAKHSYRYADRVIAVSSGVKADLLSFVGLDEQKVVTLYNPVVSSELEKLSKEPVTDCWFADSKSPIILSVGRLTPAKDFANLINAFCILRRHSDARLLILGEGPERRNLETLVAELGLQAYVKLPGFVKNPFPYMARASVYVLSSSREGLPGALIQALACGCQVVSTDCPSGPAEVLDYGKYGRLVPPGNPHALATAVQEALCEPMSRELAREGSRRFSEKECISAYVGLLTAQ